MSETQDPLIVLQHRMQQRQILAMMGINQWVQPESETINIADIETAPVRQSDIGYTNTDYSDEKFTDSETVNGSVEEKVASSSSDDNTHEPYSTSYEDVHHHADTLPDAREQQPHAKSPVTYSFDSLTNHEPVDSSTQDYHDASSIDLVSSDTAFINEAGQSTDAPVTQHQFAQSNHDDIKDSSLKKVAPFNLQGGRYGNWVVLVDIQALNGDSQKLWKNITQALSITCETTSFPICEGMDTAELANASLAGYIFKVGRSEEIQVAALTELPDGLQYPNLTTVPTLEQMLTDSDAKRQLWEQISH